MLDNIISNELDILAKTLMMDFSTSFDIFEVQDVSEELSILTSLSFAILPNDLSTSTHIVESIVRLVTTYLMQNTKQINVELFTDCYIRIFVL